MTDDPTAATPAEGLRSTLALLRAMTRFGRRRLGIALTFLVLGNLTEGISILLLLPVLGLASRGGPDYAIDLGGRSLLGWQLPDVTIGLAVLLSAIVGLVALQAVFNRVKAVYLSDLLNDFANSTRADLFSAVASARWETVVRMRRADLEHALTGEIDRINFCGFVALNLMQILVGLVIYFLLCLAVSVPMTLFAFCFGLTALLLLKPYRRLAQRYGQRIQAARTVQARLVSEFISGLKTARSMNQEPHHVAQFERTLDTTKADARDYVRRNALGNGLFQVALAVGAAGFVLLSLRVAGLEMAQMIVLLVILMRVTPRFQGLQGQVQALLVDLSAWWRVVDLQSRLEANREGGTGFASVPVPAPQGEILLDRVTYRHREGSDEAALTDCTIRLRIGEATALIGPSGAGKSTVADIVMGLIRPESGRFLVDGRELTEAERRGWREHLAYVPQETFLLHDTIRANLKIVAPSATDEDLRLALADAAADRFVAALPAGLDTRVGDRGTLLSGGERQRIALARAFLRKPSVLILDEATSALDWESQKIVADALMRRAGRMTVLTIAHRPSMVAFADRVYTLDGGRVVEEGRMADLMRSGGHLARMFAHEGADLRPRALQGG
ncbi:ABC transporter ATP-binding protein [Rhodobacter sp. CZR27]|uniref:ABC transporter ATP-binding protein n=1 Tax=Rhodobacter sp. CZR27 TaxID=2033869 RepID=UPI000BBF24BA|nr:ABC transporter ATP-binding protein [Rhodobacter sp. CZR27]